MALLAPRRGDRTYVSWSVCACWWWFACGEARGGAVSLLLSTFERGSLYVGPGHPGEGAEKYAGHLTSCWLLEDSRSSSPIPGLWLRAILLVGSLFHMRHRNVAVQVMG